MNKRRLIFINIAVLMLFFQITIFGQTRTSVQSGSWSTASTWDCTCVPGSGEDAIIASGHTVTLTGATTINNFTINDGGVFDYDGNTLTVSGTVTPFISDQSGGFDTNGTWLNGTAPTTSDKAIIIKSHTVTVNNDQIADLYVNAGAVISTANNKDMTVTSSITVDGTVKLNSTNPDLFLNTGAITVAGTGTIDATGTSQPAMTVSAATTVAFGSDLTIIGDVEIAAGITMTLEGAIIVNGNVNGLSGASQLTMGTNGGIEVNGTLLTTGTLDASGTGSTVEYNNSGAQTIKAASGAYYNLSISGTDTKTFPASTVDINGTLSVLAGTLDVNSQNITIAGDWSNSGTISNLSTVTFDGTSDQSATTNATNYVTITVNKASGILNLNEDVVVTTLTMTAGNINTSSNSLTVGSGAEGTFTHTAGRIIGTFGQYIGASTTTAFDYPIGTSSNDRTVAITFDQTGGGRSAGVVLAQFVETDPGSSGFPIADDVTLYNAFNEGYWDFTTSGFSKGNSNTFDLSLTGDGFSSFTIGSTTRLLQRDDSGTNWAADGSHGSVSTNTITRNNITTFVSQFCFGDATNCTGPSDPNISGTTDVCTSDTNDTYSVVLNSGNDYNFTVVGGTIDEAGGATTTGFVTNQNSITVDWGSTGQVGSVSVVERNTCTSSNTITQNININSIAPANITGSAIVAENSTGKAYSVTNDANTTYSWTIVGGTQASGTTTNSITVDWGSNGAGSVAVTATKTSPSCSASASTSLAITKYIVVDSDSSDAACNGEWSDTDCWATGVQPATTESATIISGNTINLKFDEEISNLVVEGTFDLNNKTLTVTGNLEIPSGGNIIATGGGTIVMSSSTSTPQATIDGLGTFTSGDIIISNASKTIASTTVLTIPGAITINAGLTLTNAGTATLSGVVDGGNASSTFTNAANANVTFSSATVPMATGILEASATGNTVTYSNVTGVTIKAPASSYYNLETSTGTQTLGTATDVNGEFTLTSGTFAMGANNMTVAGDLTYTAGTLTSTGTITLDGSANQTVSGSWSIPNLTINNTLDGSDAITLSNGITVSTTLTLTDGIVGSGSNTLTVSNCATGGISGGSSASFINGILARCTNSTSLYDFPTGESTTYKRVGITPTTTGGSTYQVEPFNAAYSDISNFGTGVNNVSGLEYWDIQRTAGADAAQVRLYWNTQAASGISQAAELLIGHYTGGQWENRGQGGSSGDVDPGYVESSTATSTFSPFSFASNSGTENPLPVDLVYFDAHLKRAGEVYLEWETASELNNDKFVIEKSSDNETFYEIGEVSGQGTTDNIMQYEFIDKNFNTSAYYRLKQVDFDGAFEYSDVKYVENQYQKSDILAYPNPIHNGQILTLDIQNESITVIKIYDIVGNLILEKSKREMNDNKLLVTNLPLGNYILLLITDNNKSYNQRIAVSK